MASFPKQLELAFLRFLLLVSLSTLCRLRIYLVLNNKQFKASVARLVCHGHIFVFIKSVYSYQSYVNSTRIFILHMNTKQLDWSDKKQTDNSHWKNKDWDHDWLLHHSVKSVQIWSFFWSEYRKIRTRKNSVFGTLFTQCMMKKMGLSTNRYVKEHTQNIKWILMLEKILIWLILLPIALTHYLGCLKFFKRFKVFLTLEFYSEPNHFDMEK